MVDLKEILTDVLNEGLNNNQNNCWYLFDNPNSDIPFDKKEAHLVKYREDIVPQKIMRLPEIVHALNNFAKYVFKENGEWLFAQFTIEIVKFLKEEGEITPVGYWYHNDKIPIYYLKDFNKYIVNGNKNSEINQSFKVNDEQKGYYINRNVQQKIKKYEEQLKTAVQVNKAKEENMVDGKMAAANDR